MLQQCPHLVIKYRTLLLATLSMCLLLLYVTHSLQLPRPFPLSGQDRCHTLSSTDDLLMFVEIVTNTNNGDRVVGNDGCTRQVAAMQLFYEIHLSGGDMVIGKQLKTALEEKVGVEAVEKLNSQVVLHMFNKWTRETTLINPTLSGVNTRDKAPLSKQQVDHLISNSAAEECDFCKVKNMTPSNRFDRVEGKFAWSAANLYKRSGPHNGLVIAKKHNYLELGSEDLASMFIVANKWFEAAAREDETLKYPSLTWDVVPKGGANQIHPHFSLHFDRERHQGHFGDLLSGSQDYERKTGGDYWADLVDLHWGLGLAVRKEFNTSVVVPLTSRRNHEYLVVYRGSQPAHLGHLVHSLTTTFKEQLGVFCWTMAAAWHPLEDEKPMSGKDRPVVLRMGARRECVRGRTRDEALQDYSFTGVSSDLYQTMHSFVLTL